MVTRCDDQDNIGDLRHGVAGATGDGDIVDMSDRTDCPNSTISLQLGALATSHNITLLGPGKDKLLISGKYSAAPDRIIEHTGTGTLTIQDVSLAGGYNAAGGIFSAAGGCIYSAGSVALDHAGVYLCRASAVTPGLATGGGIFTAYGLSLVYSSLSGNTAYAGVLGSSGAAGGGATVGGDFYAFRSSINGNSATGKGSPVMYAGGLLILGNAMIFSSTISGNTAAAVGGIYMKARSGTSALIGNSTISGNTAIAGGVGGIITAKAVTTINSSTIAFNEAQAGGSGNYAPGLTAKVPSDTLSGTLNLNSTLIANNTYGAAIENDLSVVNGTSSTVTVNGADNLVRVATVSLPSGTITGACPLLGPLRDNGGPTLTHALLSHSPAIDLGNNNNLLANDQRGPPYARQSGAAADIGAYEVQQDDIVFNAAFDGCP